MRTEPPHMLEAKTSRKPLPKLPNKLHMSNLTGYNDRAPSELLWAVVILREDFGYTFRQIGERLNLNNRVANKYYDIFYSNPTRKNELITKFLLWNQTLPQSKTTL
jgi:hypothetical protein